MSRALAYRLAVLALATVSTPALAGGNVLGSIGYRSLDDKFWGEADHQPLIGVLADFSLGYETPLYVSAGLQASAKEWDANDGSGDTITDSVVDLTFGLKVMPDFGFYQPYLGAGGASVGVSEQVDGGDGFDYDFDDQSFGYYIAGGMLLRVSDRFTLGADLRWIGGTEIRFADDKGDADSFVASVLIGWSWDDRRSEERRGDRRRRRD